VARRDQGPRLKAGLLTPKSCPLLGTASSICAPAEAVRGGEVLVCTRQLTLQFPLRPYISRAQETRTLGEVGSDVGVYTSTSTRSALGTMNCTPPPAKDCRGSASVQVSRAELQRDSKT